MKRINPFKGLGIALVTPFTNEGQVDYISLEHLIEKQIAKGVDFLCVLGCGNALSDSRRETGHH